MAKKTPRKLDEEIDHFLRGEFKGPRELAPPPKWDAKRGAWLDEDDGDDDIDMWNRGDAANFYAEGGFGDHHEDADGDAHT